MKPTDAERLAQIESHFHRLILERAAVYNGGEFTLPPIANAPRGGEKPAWFRVPGMYGGFAYHLEGEGETLMLVANSWSRVVEGSGQRHHITPAGAVLVEDGFV